MKQEKTVLEAGFPCAMYELQKAFEDGWRLSETREPLYIAGLYEIVMEKEDIISDEQVEVLEDAGVSGVADSQVIESTVQAAAKRGPKPKGK